MSTWTPSNPSTPPAGANDTYNAAKLDEFQEKFRHTLMQCRALLSGPNPHTTKQFIKSTQLSDLLYLLLQPDISRMSADLRTSYQIYLPPSVWSDIMIEEDPTTPFGKLFAHFERIMEFYYEQDSTKPMYVSWTFVAYYAGIVQHLVNLDAFEAKRWAGFVEELEYDRRERAERADEPEWYEDSLENCGLFYLGTFNGICRRHCNEKSPVLFKGIYSLLPWSVSWVGWLDV